ncbi:alpha/beta hydrolase family protein, partial [Cellulomonas soli]
EYLAAPVPEPRWLRDGDVVLGTVVTAAALLVLGPLMLLVARTGEAVAVRRARSRTVAGRPTVPRVRHRYAGGVAWWAAVFGVGASATVVALVWYLVAIARLALDYERNAAVVQGGWLVVRALGIGAVVAGVLLATRVRAVQAVGGRAAPGAVRTLALWSVCVGALVLLVVLAYWGAFQLGV